MIRLTLLDLGSGPSIMAASVMGGVGKGESSWASRGTKEVELGTGVFAFVCVVCVVRACVYVCMCTGVWVEDGEPATSGNAGTRCRRSVDDEKCRARGMRRYVHLIHPDWY